MFDTIFFIKWFSKYLWKHNFEIQLEAAHIEIVFKLSWRSNDYNFSST